MTPERWRSAKLSDVCGLQYGKSLPAAARQAGEVPVFGSNGLVGTHDQALVAGPGIVVGRKGSIGEIAWSESGFWPIDTTYWVDRRGDVDLRWLFYILRSIDLRALNTATGVPGLNREDAYRVALGLPPLGEQRKIAAILSSVDEAIEATQAVIDQLQVVKKAMMTELLTEGLPGRHTRFKQTEIGEVPEGWEIMRMDLLAEAKGMVGGPFGSDLTAKDYVDEPGVPVIRGGNVSMGSFSEEDYVFVSDEKARVLSKNSARPGDLVMTQRGASLGEVAIIPHQPQYAFYIISQTMMRMTPDASKVSPRFLLHYTCSEVAQRWLQNHQVATGQPHLNLGIYREMPALVPGRDEQDAIARMMDRIDETLGSNIPVLQELCRLKSGLMSALLTGELRVTPEPEPT